MNIVVLLNLKFSFISVILQETDEQLNKPSSNGFQPKAGAFKARKCSCPFSVFNNGTQLLTKFININTLAFIFYCDIYLVDDHESNTINFYVKYLYHIFLSTFYLYLHTMYVIYKQVYFYLHENGKVIVEQAFNRH